METLSYIVDALLLRYQEIYRRLIMRSLFRYDKFF